MALFKFPRTPHLAWLGSGKPRDDKVLSDREREAFLDGEILVEEKVDGANLGLSLAEHGGIRAQSRGAYLSRGCHPQFGPLWAWLATRERAVASALGGELILFGEWCFAVHSVRYDRLPDWFLGFDVYDRAKGRFWSSTRRDALLASLCIFPVPSIGRGRYSLGDLRDLLDSTHSRLGAGPPEGLYLRREDGLWFAERAKLIRSEFAEAIDQHWSHQRLRRNRLSQGPSRAVR